MPLDPQPTETVQQLPVMALHESTFQPRQTWGTAALAELTSSVRERGVLQPIVVRPHPAKAGEYEIVFGHRRATAARGAPLQTIPAIVRTMTDDEVRIAQAMENLQREDLTPLDEARQYQALLAALKVDQKTLAARVGKSEAHVSQRLRLLTATAEVQAAVAAGEISAEVAQLIARQPKASQTHWLHEAKHGGAYEFDQETREERNFPATVDQLRLMLRNKSKPLGKAVFDITDAKLLPKAGACTSCPHRSGNSPDHAEGDDPNRCGNADCYEAKEEAHYAAKKKALQAAKVKILAGSESWDAEHKLSRGQLVDITKVDPAIDKTRTLAEVLGKHQAGAVALTDYAGGIKSIAMAPTALEKALKAAGVTAESQVIKKAAEKAKKSEATKAQRAPKTSEFDRWKLDRAFEDGVRDALCAAILAGGPQSGDLAEAVLLMIDHTMATTDDIKRMVAGKDIKGNTRNAPSFDKLNALPPPVLARALMQLVVWAEIADRGVDDNETVTRLLKRYAVDPEPIREKVYGKPETDVDKAREQAVAVAKAAKKAKGKK